MVHTVTLAAVGIDLPDVGGHPNAVPFRGILTRLNEPSDKPPGGAQGHRVRIPRAVAEAALSSIVGMAVNVAPGFDDHDARRKIGIFTSGDIDGNAVIVGGILYAKDFPRETAFIRTNKDRLGLSFEITDVAIKDTAAPIWELTAITFTGAAILWKDAAAYRTTALAAAAAQPLDDPVDAMTALCKRLVAEAAADVAQRLNRLEVALLKTMVERGSSDARRVVKRWLDLESQLSGHIARARESR